MWRGERQTSALSPLGDGASGLGWSGGGGWVWLGGGGGLGGGGWLWGGAGASGPDGWAWDNVVGGGVGVDLDGDSWVAHLEGAWEGDEVGGVWEGGAGTGDGELGALWVELRSAGLVESEDLVADEVVSWLEGGGDRGGPLEGVEDDGVAPLALVDGSGKETGLGEELALRRREGEGRRLPHQS